MRYALYVAGAIAMGLGFAAFLGVIDVSRLEAGSLGAAGVIAGAVFLGAGAVCSEIIDAVDFLARAKGGDSQP